MSKDNKKLPDGIDYITEGFVPPIPPAAAPHGKKGYVPPEPPTAPKTPKKKDQ